MCREPQTSVPPYTCSGCFRLRKAAAVLVPCGISQASAWISTSVAEQSGNSAHVRYSSDYATAVIPHARTRQGAVGHGNEWSRPQAEDIAAPAKSISATAVCCSGKSVRIIFPSSPSQNYLLRGRSGGGGGHLQSRAQPPSLRTAAVSCCGRSSLPSQPPLFRGFVVYAVVAAWIRADTGVGATWSYTHVRASGPSSDPNPRFPLLGGGVARDVDHSKNILRFLSRAQPQPGVFCPRGGRRHTLKFET